MPVIPRPPKAGKLHRTKAFSIPGLKGQHPLTVYLPPGYFEGTEHYPVAYFFDGQNLFGDQGSFSGGWHLHEALDARAAKGKRVPIVVGIHHGGASRMEELTPWVVSKGHQPRGDQLLDWVIGPLAGFVAEDLRVLKGAENTLVGGSSLGGLLSLYAFFRHPEHFGRVLSMSPALWVGKGQVFRLAERIRPLGPARIYLDCGGREGAAFRQAQTMASLLESRGFDDGALLWRPDARGTHNERNWARRLPKALKYLYD